MVKSKFAEMTSKEVLAFNVKVRVRQLKCPDIFVKVEMLPRTVGVL